MSFKPIFLVGEMGRGGQERQLRYLLHELATSGKPCSLVIWEPSEKYLHDVQEIQSWGVSILRHTESGLWQKIRRTKQFVREQKGSVLQSFSFYLNFYTGIIGILCRIPAVGAVRNRLFITYETDGIFRFLLSSLLPRLKITNNRLYQDGLKFPCLKLLYRKTCVVPNQLDMTGKVYARRKGADTVKSCSIGRLYPEKDIYLLIDAIHHAVKMGLRIQHQHAGKGPLLQNLQAYAKERNLQAQFEFIGELNNVQDLLDSSDLFLHSSRAEGYPNVIMEAMSSGKPILTTRCGDAEDLVLNGVNGFHVPIGDLASYAERLQFLLSNQDQLQQFGERSFELAKEKFALENLMLDTIEAYESFGIDVHV